MAESRMLHCTVFVRQCTPTGRQSHRRRACS